MFKDTSARYYQKTKASKKACERCLDLSEKEKNKKGEYDHKRYQNFPAHEKQRLAEYRKKQVTTDITGPP